MSLPRGARPLAGLGSFSDVRLAILSKSKGTIPRDVDDDLQSAASQGNQATWPTLFKESIRLFFGIVGRVALAQFALGFIPERVFATLGPAGHLP
jgi:hypothetical protein